MNKTAIKRFAVQARKQLMTDIIQKAYELGITKVEIKDPEVFEGGFRVNQQLFKPVQMNQREQLVRKVRTKGFEQVIEEVAYTWFNRFIALRFMEVNEYLPTGVRVLSSEKPGKTEPDIIAEALEIDLAINKELVYQWQDGNQTDELYKYLLIKQCNALHQILPVMFEEINDYTEILLPNNLLQEDSIIGLLVTMIDEDDWKGQVEIIGWLYQFYISEKKDEVFAGLKDNTKITKENVPAATQLFTPKWIVQYMVENSLGRLWLEREANSELKGQWTYFQDVSGETQNNEPLNLEDIKLLDPCMGSGHILVYAFDVLYQMYASSGYASKDIPKYILEKNLYGLDIDDRAAQLAYFAVMMKARSYSRRLFREQVQVNLYSIQETGEISADVINYFVGDGTKIAKEEVFALIHLYKEGKEYGSIVEASEIKLEQFEARLEEIKNSDSEDLLTAQYKGNVLETFPPLLQQTKLLQLKYDVVVTNPPYMRRRNMNQGLNKYVTERFLSPEDYFSVFIEKGFSFLKPNGFNAMVTTQSWMFLSTYERLRDYLLSEKQLYSLLHMDANVMISFATVAAVWRNTQTNINSAFTFFQVSDLAKDEPLAFPSESKRNTRKNQERFFHLPGKVLAYWCSEKLENAFKNGVAINEKYDPKSGIKTGNNEQFLKFWHEVNFSDIGFQMKNYHDLARQNYTWYPYNKGGGYRKWYGNVTHVILLKDEGRKIRETISKDVYRLREPEHYFKETICWPLTGADKFSSKYIEQGTLLDVASCGIYFERSIDKTLLGFLNSKVSNEILNMLNPTLSFPVNSISSLPLTSIKETEKVETLVEECISITKEEWNSFEESWGFQQHPFLVHQTATSKLEDAYQRWQEHTKRAFQTLKKNEEAINRIFIDAYGLEEEISEEILDQDINYRQADLLRDIKAFISYGVGCMLGRYSLDEEGIIFAGGSFQEDRYQTFKPSTTNILPITDTEYFADDIVTRFTQFVKASFGEEMLEVNLQFIAEALNKKASESTREAIRRYFMKDFFKDHFQFSKKRPFYWLFDSGKQNGFKALVYMQRYDEGLVARVRTDYLHELQRKYESELERLNMLLESDVSAREKTATTKRKNTIQKQLLETQSYDQVMAHIANKRLNIHLEDGVKVNYMKFQGVDIPQGEGKQRRSMSLLTDVKL